jgi:signal transduction histidine kinase
MGINVHMIRGVHATFLSRIRDCLIRPFVRPLGVIDQAELMARLSHEMRTSLTGIVGYSEFLESTSKEPMVNFTAKIIKESSQSLARVSSSFFDLQSIESRKLKLSNSWFSVRELVRNVIQIHQPLARERNVNLLFTSSDDLFLIEMYADVLRVRQVLDALIYGAIQSTRKGESIHIDMMLDSLKAGVIVKIISPDTHVDSAQIELFKQFWNDENYNFRLQEGPGIEMALAKSLIYLMQGVAVYRTSNRQTPELVVSLPICCDLSKRRV